MWFTKLWEIRIFLTPSRTKVTNKVGNAFVKLFTYWFSPKQDILRYPLGFSESFQYCIFSCRQSGGCIYRCIEKSVGKLDIKLNEHEENDFMVLESYYSSLRKMEVTAGLIDSSCWVPWFNNQRKRRFPPIF